MIYKLNRFNYKQSIGEFNFIVDCFVGPLVPYPYTYYSEAIDSLLVHAHNTDSYGQAIRAAARILKKLRV